MLEPDPDTLQAQPAVGREVTGEVGPWQHRVDQTGRGEEGRVADLRPRQVVGGVAVVEPPVQVLELPLEVRGPLVRRRHGDAERAQRLDGQADRLREPLPVAEAAHLQVPRVGARHHAGAQRLDRPVLLVRLLQASHAVERGVASGPQRDERGRLVGVGQLQRGAQQRVHQHVVADQPRLVGGAPEEAHHLTALRLVVDGVDDRQVLLRRHREQLRHPGQPPRHRQLHGLPPPRVQPLHDRVPDAVVAEPHRLSRPGLHHQQALVQRRRQSLRQRGRRLAGRRLHDAQVDLPAEAGHDLRRRPRAGRQGLDPRHQQLGRLGPAEVGADRRDVPPPPGGGRGDEPLAAQGVEQLHGLVRVAVGMRCDRLDELRRRTPVRVHHLGDQADRGGHGQVVEVQVLHVGPPARPRQRARQRVRRIDVVIAVGTDQQQPVDRFFAQQEVEQAERGAAGPLQVVDEEHHRPLG